MLRGLTPQQFFGWLHYEELEPFGERRADMRTAFDVTHATGGRGGLRPALGAFLRETDVTAAENPRQGRDWRQIKQAFLKMAATFKKAKD